MTDGSLADPGTEMQFSPVLCHSIKRRRFLQFTVDLSAWSLIRAESPVHISTDLWSQPLKESPSRAEVPDTLFFPPGLITTITAGQAFPRVRRNSPASTIQFHMARVRSVAPLVHLSPFCASVTQDLKLGCCDSNSLVAHSSGVQGNPRSRCTRPTVEGQGGSHTAKGPWGAPARKPL